MGPGGVIMFQGISLHGGRGKPGGDDDSAAVPEQPESNLQPNLDPTSSYDGEPARQVNLCLPHTLVQV